METSGARFLPGARVCVWIAQRDDVVEGDGGTVIAVREGTGGGSWYVDVILDTGLRLGNYHEYAFVEEEDFNRAKS